jgi:hypothetical protein
MNDEYFRAPIWQCKAPPDAASKVTAVTLCAAVKAFFICSSCSIGTK